MQSPARQASPGAEPFRVEVHPERTIVRIAPAGELDVASAPTLAAELQELRDSGFDCLVLDLRRLTFMDSTGIALLLAEDARARRNGHDFRLISGPPAIQRVMQLCGVAGLLRYESPSRQQPPPRSAPQPAEAEFAL